jgi:hypothetical protein
MCTVAMYSSDERPKETGCWGRLQEPAKDSIIQWYFSLNESFQVHSSHLIHSENSLLRFAFEVDGRGCPIT